MKKITVVIISAIIFFSCSGKQTFDLDIQKIVCSVDVFREVCKNAETIPLYQGNGRWGCSYGALGLHDHPDAINKYGKTQWLHLQHHVRAKFNIDYLLPLAKIYWETTPENIHHYTQHQSFYDGLICTQYEYGSSKIKTTTWFDPVDRDVAGIKIELHGTASDLILKPFGEMRVHYQQNLLQSFKISQESDLWKIELINEDKSSTLLLKTNANVQKEEQGLRISLRQGENNILISFNQPIETSIAESLEQTKRWWHEKWTTSGFLAIPDVEAQKMWVRSMAMFLSSYNDDGAVLTPPCGFSGNGWPFSFPQDVSFINPVLLATGNIDIAKAWIEHWANSIDGMKAYTKWLLGVEGILAPWVYPYSDFQGFQEPEPPNSFYYELHNSGYLARMAHETAIFVNDDVWTKQFVLPLIRETADFYKNISSKGDDGFWHLFITPSMGQDEMGGANQKNYLCALYSAKYCFQRAIDYGLDPDGTFRQMLNNLAFPTLLTQQGIYYTCAGSGESDFGKQKHPVQLNDLAFLPVDSVISCPSRKAYELRYEITRNAKTPFFYGWTLGEFLLAGSRYGNPQEWKTDWDNIIKSDYVDPEWIQVYETSKSYGMTFYNTTNGLIAQSLINNLVTDWFGKLEIAKCNPWSGKIFIKNIYSKLGVIIDGTIEGKSAELILKAWKDAEFELNGKTIKMNEGEQINYVYICPSKCSTIKDNH